MCFVGGEDEAARGEEKESVTILSPGSLFEGVRRTTWLMMVSVTPEGILTKDMVFDFCGVLPCK